MELDGHANTSVVVDLGVPLWDEARGRAMAAGWAAMVRRQFASGNGDRGGTAYTIEHGPQERTPGSVDVSELPLVPVSDHSHVPVPDLDDDDNLVEDGDSGGTLYARESWTSMQGAEPSDLPVALSCRQMLARLESTQRSLQTHADYPLVRDCILGLCRQFICRADAINMVALSNTFSFSDFSAEAGRELLCTMVECRNIIGSWNLRGDIGGTGC